MKFFFFLTYIELSIPAPYSKEYSRHIVLLNKQKKIDFLKFWNPPNPLKMSKPFMLHDNNDKKLLTNW